MKRGHSEAEEPSAEQKRIMSKPVAEQEAPIMSKPEDQLSPEEKKRFVRRLAKAFGTCTEEGRQYGLCLKSYLEGVERGACSAQFEALSRCFKKGLRTAK